MVMRNASTRAGRLGRIVLIASLAIPAFADQYAVLFSGGLDPEENYYYFHQDTLRMWDLTVNTLHFNPSHVYILASDGTDPTPDQNTTPWSTPHEVNSDWSTALAQGTTVEAGTHANLQDLLATLAATMGPADSFYFFSFTHGGPGPLGSTQMWGWNPDPNSLDDFISANDFAAWTSAFNVESQVYAFDQCYAMGMAFGLTQWGQYPRNNMNWFAAWSTSWTIASHGDAWASAWEDGIAAGIFDTILLGTYAKDNDWVVGLTGDEPGFMGANIDIETGHPDAPEPAAVALLGTVVLVLLGVRKFRVP